jgi:hypothetical protein
VAGATPFPKVGWPDHPIFGQGVASATPYRPYGGGRSHPRPLGVVRPPPKKKGGKMGFGLWGWPDHPLGPGGGFGHPLAAVGGGFGHLHALGGGPATPKGQNPFFPFFFFFFFLGLLGWPDHPQRPGVASATPIRPVWGGRSHPLAKNGVVRPPHFWEGATPIPSSSFFSFSFLFFFNFLLFFKKKKKTKT